LNVHGDQQSFLIPLQTLVCFAHMRVKLAHMRMKMVVAPLARRAAPFGLGQAVWGYY
jgi:hypothetical protein